MGLSGTSWYLETFQGFWDGEAGRSCGGLGSVGVVGGDVFDCEIRGVSEKRNGLSGW